MGKGTFSCVKWLLTVFNVIFLVYIFTQHIINNNNFNYNQICGLAICSIAIWMFVSPSMAHELIGQHLTPIIAYVLLSCGGIIILISFCGCAGAGLENRCLLCLVSCSLFYSYIYLIFLQFFTVLCGIFVACLVASILVAIFRKDVRL